MDLIILYYHLFGFINTSQLQKWVTQINIMTIICFLKYMLLLPNNQKPAMQTQSDVKLVRVTWPLETSWKKCIIVTEIKIS